MVIVQDAFYIPDDIATGIATGLYRRIGNVIRYAMGPNKGQIVKMLEPVDLEKVAQAKGVGVKVLQFAQGHTKEIGIGAGVVGLAGLAFWGYHTWKHHEPKVLTAFRVALKDYIEGIRQGDMDSDRINNMLLALEELKKHKDYNKISVQLTSEELEVLVGRIYEYTLKLAETNAVPIAENELSTNNGAIVDLQSYLKVQKRIFESAA